MENPLSISPPPESTEPPAVDAAPGELTDEARRRIHSSASWFFTIAALSLINSIAAHAGSSWNFIMGLALTQIVDGVMAAIGGTPGVVVAFVFDLTVALVFVGIGFLARGLQYWAFLLGMIIYGLDGLVFLGVGEYLGFAFHLFALFNIFLGFRILHQNRRETARRTST